MDCFWQWLYKSTCNHYVYAYAFVYLYIKMKKGIHKASGNKNKIKNIKTTKYNFKKLYFSEPSWTRDIYKA